jgi:signal transduction histidine kinase
MAEITRRQDEMEHRERQAASADIGSPGNEEAMRTATRSKGTRPRFSEAEIAEAAELMASEHRGKRLLMSVTKGHRTLAMRHGTAAIVVGGLTVAALYVIELKSPSVDARSLDAWFVFCVASIVSRTAMYVWLFNSYSPAEVVKSTALRLVPLAIALISAAQWIWSIELFASDRAGAASFVLFAGLVGNSVAVAGMWPTAPLAVLAYLTATWATLFHRLYIASPEADAIIVASAACVGVVLWASSYLQVHQVKNILNRSDEVDLLLARLHRANGELTAANSTLDAMNSTATAELEHRSMFFTSASHDFRQRLHAMNLLANAALSSTGDEGSESAPLRRLADCIEDVEHYVTHVLDFARFDRSATHPVCQRLELQSLFQKLELNFEDIATERGVTLVIRSTDVVLYTDASMLQRILENLISNAIKFTRKRVLVATRKRGSAIAIQVWDQGDGIAPEDQAAIFTPFYRSRTADRHHGGVGLGLAVVQRFAECLGCEIRLRSQMGRGTVMTLLLPGGDGPDPSQPIAG